MPYSRNQHVCLSSYAINYRMSQSSLVSGFFFGGTHSLFPSVSNWGGFCFNHRLAHWERSRVYAAIDVANALEVINDLGLDTLTFLAVTVLVVPAFKIVRASPVSIASILQSFSLQNSLSLSLCVVSFSLLCINTRHIRLSYI